MFLFNRQRDCFSHFCLHAVGWMVKPSRFGFKMGFLGYSLVYSMYPNCFIQSPNVDDIIAFHFGFSLDKEQTKYHRQKTDLVGWFGTDSISIDKKVYEFWQRLRR
jgi:hypothetical protein